jgi:L-iditol 2-dehydrogenase
MRAVVYRGVNDLRLETVPVPRIGAHELLVKVAVCGVCPTDIKKIQNGTVPPPRIFGHETAGTIVKIGGNRTSLEIPSPIGWERVAAGRVRVGDRVALHHHVPCLECHFCRHRAFAQCETYKRTGITAGFEPAGGGYAEYVRVLPFVLPGVVKIPAKNSFEEGALLEPVNTVLKAVRRLNLLRGDAVLVAGQGPIGLMFTRLLQLQGVRVLATDLLESRLRLAKKFGARWIRTPPLSHPMGEGVRRTGEGFLSLVTRHLSPLDAAIIAVPSDAVVRQALQLVRGGGQVMLFAHTRRAASVERRASRVERRQTRGASSSLSAAGGGEDPCPSPAGAGEGGTAVPGEGCGAKADSCGEVATPIPQPSTLNSKLDFSSICLDEKDLLGSYSADFTLQGEVARLVFSRQLDVRRLISHRFPLEQTAAAVALAASPTPDSLKILVTV